MFSIYSNQISGAIPVSIGNLSNLVSFNAGYNQLESEIPESIGNLINLQRLWLNLNYLTGLVPNTICNLNLLNWSADGFEGSDSYLNYNQLCPPYPACIEEYIGEQNTSACPEIQLGDINYDGAIDVIDVVLIVNMILGSTDQNLSASDMNNDGELDVIDVVLLVNLILGD